MEKFDFSGIKKDELKKTLNKCVILGQTIASFTPTDKDDKAVAVLDAIVNTPEVFDKVCEAIGVTNDPAPAPAA